MSDIVSEVVAQISHMFQTTDEILSVWSQEGNLQFPTLLGMLSTKMNWNEKQTREADPLIRFYIRRNPNYHVTRGAGGGIMKASEKMKKEESRSAKDLIKKQMMAALEAKVAATTVTVNSNTNNSIIDNE